MGVKYKIIFEIETEDYNEPLLTPQIVLSQFHVKVEGELINYAQISRAEIINLGDSSEVE